MYAVKYCLKDQEISTKCTFLKYYSQGSRGAQVNIREKFRVILGSLSTWFQIPVSTNSSEGNLGDDFFEAFMPKLVSCEA